MRQTVAQLTIIVLALILAFNPGGVLTWEVRILLLGLLFIGSVLLLQPRASRQQEEAERIANETDWEEQQRRAVTDEPPPVPDPYRSDGTPTSTSETEQSSEQKRED